VRPKVSPVKHKGS